MTFSEIGPSLQLSFNAKRLYQADIRSTVMKFADFQPAKNSENQCYGLERDALN